MSHTPGPWTQNGFAVEQAEIVGRRVTYMIASLYGRDDDRSGGEVIANARLMAAAPDLLEACRRALKIIPMYTHFMQDVEATLEAAIAKAEGK